MIKLHKGKLAPPKVPNERRYKMKKLALLPPIILSAVAAVFAAKEKQASAGNCIFPPDYLIILGCRVRGDRAEPTLQMRIEKAAQYLLENGKTTAVCCGGIVHADQTKSEAETIAQGLIARGIDESRIIIENKSTTTKENFVNAKKLVPSLGSEKSAAILSSEFHLMRASLIAKKQGLSLPTVSAPSPENERIKNYIREFIVYPMAIMDK